MLLKSLCRGVFRKNIQNNAIFTIKCMFFLYVHVEKIMMRPFYFTITLKNRIIVNKKMPFYNHNLKKTYI